VIEAGEVEIAGTMAGWIDCVGGTNLETGLVMKLAFNTGFSKIHA
jgi:hypothetical protein